MKPEKKTKTEKKGENKCSFFWLLCRYQHVLAMLQDQNLRGGGGGAKTLAEWKTKSKR